MLTGALNRITFHEKVREVLRRDDFYGQHALLILDIDHFKGINDSLGHQFGDQVLGDSAAILKRELRKDDLCGRIGGDEFMVFLNDVPSEKELEPRIAQICKSLTRCYEGYGTVSCSMELPFIQRMASGSRSCIRKRIWPCTRRNIPGDPAISFTGCLLNRTVRMSAEK